MIVAVGDTHGEFEYLNKLLNRHQDIELVLQCGDFGWWPKFHNRSYVDSYGKVKRMDQFSLKNKKTIVRWCDGNHEDHPDIIERVQNNNLEFMPNVFYQPRGSTFTLPDGRVVLFIGGALSIDKQWRTVGLDWFPEETITQRDIYNLPDVNVDIVISHTCPREFFNFLDLKYILIGHQQLKADDPSMDALSTVLEKYNPKKWYFGHFHKFKMGSFRGCEWVALSCVGSDERWWIRI